MLRILNLLILISLIAGCSSASMKRLKDKKKNDEAPKWVYDTDEACPANKLCAVGEGTGHMLAEANARKALAKIFETKVKSNTKIYTSSSSTSDEGVVEGNIEEDMYKQIEEATEQALKGVEISKKYEDDESIFALAVLNKTVAAKRLKSEMKTIDDQLVVNYKDGRRSKLAKALKQFVVRERLNDRHEFLAGSRYASPVSYAGIMGKKKKKMEMGTTIYVDVKEVGKINEVEHIIIKKLLENDFRVVTSANKKHEFKLEGRLKSEQQHFNVDGFEKHKFMLQLKSMNGLGQKIGALDYSVAKSGRSKAQAYQHAMEDILDYLDDKIDELNID